MRNPCTLPLDPPLKLPFEQIAMSHLVFIAKTGVSSLFHHCSIIVPSLFCFIFLGYPISIWIPIRTVRYTVWRFYPYHVSYQFYPKCRNPKKGKIGERTLADTARLNKASAEVIYKPCSPLKVSNEPQLFAFLISCRYYKLRGVRRFNQKE